ncbi:hypothetical protein B0H15DRAFT_978124 [Mycena belliarum]|uniref:Polysaccharide lyase 14 domain-containing protein n=1 Tax=Mycena belliarum TaxID=1033014 RepID=A0AAD6TMN5_9AGAR|nr:hypothetical protein B0H15DRAFT_978124 [Mycena belliae]
MDDRLRRAQRAPALRRENKAFKVGGETTHDYVAAPDVKQVMQAKFPKGSYIPSKEPRGGFSFYAAGPAAVQQGREAPGHLDPTCFSTRLMWRTNGAGELYTYLPDPFDGAQFAVNKKICDIANSHCNPDYGSSIAHGTFTFPTGKWMALSERVKLNTAGKADGELELFVDGKSVISATGLILRDSDKGRMRGIQAGADIFWWCDARLGVAGRPGGVLCRFLGRDAVEALGDDSEFGMRYICSMSNENKCDSSRPKLAARRHDGYRAEDIQGQLPLRRDQVLCRAPAAGKRAASVLPLLHLHKGYLFLFPPKSALAITKGAGTDGLGGGVLAAYTVDDKQAEHRFCATCATPSGIVRFGAAPDSCAALNARMLQGVDLWALGDSEVPALHAAAAYAPPAFPGLEVLAAPPLPAGEKLYPGSCHCGAVTFALTSPWLLEDAGPTDTENNTVAECDCSTCIRHAGFYTYPRPASRVAVAAAAPDALATCSRRTSARRATGSAARSSATCVARVAALPPHVQARICDKCDVRPVQVRALDFVLGRTEGSGRSGRA